MVHVSFAAIWTRNRRVEIGDSMQQFLQVLGIGDGGGPHGGHTTFRKQIEALAACRLSIGMTTAGRAVTVDVKPIQRFEAWLHHCGDQQTLWPGHLELSNELYETTQHHAVPLDDRALSALKYSALALDVSPDWPSGSTGCRAVSRSSCRGPPSTTSSARGTPGSATSASGSCKRCRRCKPSTRKPVCPPTTVG